MIPNIMVDNAYSVAQTQIRQFSEAYKLNVTGEDSNSDLLNAAVMAQLDMSNYVNPETDEVG